MTLTVQFIDLDTGKIQTIQNNYVQNLRPVVNPLTKDLIGFKGITRDIETCKIQKFLICAKPGCSLHTFEIDCSNR